MSIPDLEVEPTPGEPTTATSSASARGTEPTLAPCAETAPREADDHDQQRLSACAKPPSPWTSTPPTEPGLYWLHSPRREETWGLSSFIVEAQRVELDGRSWLVLRGTALGAPDHHRQCFNYDLLPGHLTLPGDLWAPATPPPRPM